VAEGMRNWGCFCDEENTKRMNSGQEKMKRSVGRLTPRLSLTDWLPKFEVAGKEAISTGCFGKGPLRTRGVEKRLR